MPVSLTHPTGGGTRTRDLALLALLAAAVLLPSLWTRQVWAPDESRYLEVAREMVVSGDYIVPRLNGVAYADKPPLFFWLTAALYRLGLGIDSGRVLAVLCSCGTILVTWSLARRLMPGPGPLIAAAVTLTSGLFIAVGPAGVIDPLLALLITAAIAAGRRALEPDNSRRPLWWIAAYLLAALAVLTKGPVGLVVPALVLACHALLNRGGIRSGLRGHLLGSFVFLAVCLAWFIPAAVFGGPAYTRTMLLSHAVGSVLRYMNHRDPFYTYVVTYPINFLPWLLLVPLAGVAAVRAWLRGRDPAALFPVIWFAAPFILFSFMSAKRTGYLLPIVPAAGLLVGGYVAAGLRGGFPWPRCHALLLRTTFTLVLLAALALAVAAPLAHRFALKLWDDPDERVDISAFFGEPARIAGLELAAAVLVAAAVAGLILLRRDRATARPFALLTGTAAAIALAVSVLLLPVGDHAQGPGSFYADALPVLRHADRICFVSSDLNGAPGLYTGYVGVPVLDGFADEIRRNMAGRPEDEIKGVRDEAQRKEVRRVLASRQKVALITRAKSLDRIFKDLHGRLPDGCRVAVSGRSASFVMQVVINWTPSAPP